MMTVIEPITDKEWYKAPSNKVFNDLKENAIKIWQTYDNTYGYVDEKVGRIKDLENIRDNWTILITMFDSHNQKRLFNQVTLEASRRLLQRVFLTQWQVLYGQI